MNSAVWEKFKKTRERFRTETEKLDRALPKLKNIQQKFADNRGGKNSSYKVETPVVYNTALDDIIIDDEIKLILVADNPGRREQAKENRRYLVGPSGKIAAKFFKDNPSLGIDFYKNVIILNKTPIHTPRTNELREICRIERQTGGSAISSALEESQKNMASLLLEFHRTLGVPVYIIGYSEMKKGGIFEIYTEKLKELYADKRVVWKPSVSEQLPLENTFSQAESRENVRLVRQPTGLSNKSKEQMYKQIYFYRHFSMNQFTIDLKKQAMSGETVSKTLERIGTAYRKRILGK